MQPSIHFIVTFSRPQTHYAEIQMHLRGFSVREKIDLKMPVWTPGSYLIREYAKNVERLHAQTIDGRELAVEKTSKNTWSVSHGGDDIVVRYAVYAFESSVRTSFIDDTHAFLSPAGTFLYVDPYLHLPCTVAIEMPPQWHRVATGLERTEVPNQYRAANFDILYDSPLEIGNHATWTFAVDGVLHEYAMVGKADYDAERITQDVSRIISEENRIWGSNPNTHYTFITHHYQSGSGGLEHLNSSILTASRFAYSQTASYKSYLSLVAHEYFHLWHVKRLRPKALGPFDYEQENYTTSLWIMEGFTAYYDNLIIRRCGFFDENEYLQQLAIDFNTVYNRAGHRYQSAAAASFDAWIKQYRPDENSANTSISYYNKGAMLAVALDIEILVRTEGRMRLDDVLRAAYKQFHLIEDRGFEEDEFRQLAEQVTGVELTEIFQAAYGSYELDYNRYFNRVGYALKDLNATPGNLSLGIKIAQEDNKNIIKSIDRDSGAWVGGLNVEDELIAVNGYRLDMQGRALEYVLARASAGEEITCLVARDGLIRTLQIPVQPSEKRNYVIEAMPNADADAVRLGKLWLSL